MISSPSTLSHHRFSPDNSFSPLELFLPHYADYDSSELEHKPDPVQEIFISDEEAAAMMPQ